MYTGKSVFFPQQPFWEVLTFSVIMTRKRIVEFPQVLGSKVCLSNQKAAPYKAVMDETIAFCSMLSLALLVDRGKLINTMSTSLTLP